MRVPKSRTAAHRSLQVGMVFCLGLFGGATMKREANILMSFMPTMDRDLAASSDDVTTEASGSQQDCTNPKKARICHENPYKNSLLEGHSFELADEKASLWVANKTNIRNALYAETHDKIVHAKFNGFEVMAPCSYSCTGECRADNSKIVCGMEHLQEGCIIYSIGGNNNWEFEENLYDMTPCHIYTFDCTGPRERFDPPERIRDRHSFYHICLATEPRPPPEEIEWQGRSKNTIYGAMETLQGMQAMLNHTRLDLLKMDIEGYEWPIFDSWPELVDLEESSKVSLPMQILTEVHYVTQMRDLRPAQPEVPFKTEIELVHLQEHLLKMGYVVAIRDDNRMCPHCTELTLLRYKCV